MCAHHWAPVVTLSSSRAGIVDSLFIPTAWETNSPWPMLGKWLNKRTNGWINGCVRMKCSLMLSHVSRLWNPCPRGLCHTRATKLGLARWRVRSSPKGCATQLAWNICLWNHLHNCNIFKVQIWYHFTWMLIRCYFASSFLFTEQRFKMPFNVFVCSSFPEFSIWRGAGGGGQNSHSWLCLWLWIL